MMLNEISRWFKAKEKLARIAFGLLTTMTFFVPVQAKEWTLTPDDDVRWIVEDAQDGDVIRLKAGVYPPLIVRGAVHVVGIEPGVVIDAHNQGYGVMVRMPRARIENLTIRNFGGNLYNRDAGVRVTDGADEVQLINLTIQGPGFGIRADRLNGIVIDSVKIEGVRSRMVLDRGDGVFLNYVKNPVLRNNSVRNVRDGFYFENVEKSLSVNNFFTGAQYGIHYMYTRDDVAHDNRVGGTIGGYALMSADRIRLENNRTEKNVEFGILLNVCDQCRVTGNRVEGVHNPRGNPALETDGKGLFIYGAGASWVEGNYFSGADIGIGVALGGEGNVITGNAFLNNTLAVRYVGESSLEWSHDGVGNFWDVALNWDINQDQIADRPYQPNSSLDRLFWIYPEAKFLMDSPVVALLRWLSSQFEIDRGKGVTDSYPLMRAPEVAGGHFETSQWGAQEAQP